MRACLLLGLLTLGASLPSKAQELVSNGDFEAGLADWTIWSASSDFWNGSWIHANDCDIWVPTNGCPFAGAVSHSQKKGSGGGNAHGGIFQQIAVETGRQYRVRGQWSGGVTGNIGGNATWWEVVVYDGVVSPAVIDAGLRPQDQLIEKIEIAGLGNNEVFQYPWQPFEGVFTAPSDLVTLAFKHGSFYTFDAASYHDDVSVQLLPQPTLQVEKVAALLVDPAGDGLADRGDRLRFDIVVRNPTDGDALAVTTLQLTDILPAGLQLVPGTVTSTLGVIALGNTAGDTSVQVDVPTLDDGAAVTVTFEAVIDPALDPAITSLANQAQVSGDNIADTVSDDPATGATFDATVVAVQQDQAISGFAADPPSGVFQGTTVLTAVGGSSGNPVVFASTTPGICSVSGNTVTFLAVGSCEVSANQAGNADFNAAPQVTLAIPVGPAAQVISFGPAPALVVDATATVTATGGASGNPVVFTSLTPAVCTVSGSNGSTVTGVAVGTCTIAASQAGNGNYQAAAEATLSFPVDAAIPATLPVGGTITGYVGSGLVLRLNADIDLPVAAGATQFVFPEIANGSDYLVTVFTQPSEPSQACTVSNGQGTLAGVAVTNVVVSCQTTALPPGPPTGITLAFAGGDVTVSWTAPANDGGSAITSYTVQLQPDGLSCTVSGSPPPVLCTLGGVRSDVLYTATVTAINGIGAGAPGVGSGIATRSGPIAVSVDRLWALLALGLGLVLAAYSPLARRAR